MSDYLPALLERVSEWYADRYGRQVQVVGMKAENNEWVGNTDAGWHDEIQLDLTLADGTSDRLYSADQESLWRWVLSPDAKDQS